MLHLAAECSGEEIVKLLLEHRADKNAVDNHGKTPLEGAIQLKKEEIVQLLDFQIPHG